MTLEIDCAAVGKELYYKDPTRSKCFPLVADIKQTLSVFDGHCILVVRNSNALAHELAATAIVSGDQVMIANVPGKTEAALEVERVKMHTL